MKQVLDLDSHTELFVTGHSLGAALSVLFGIRLALKIDNNAGHQLWLRQGG